MHSHEPFIHCDPCPDPYTENHLKCTVSIPQGDLDAIVSLINWLDGYSEGSSKAIPGHFELQMLYRGLRSAFLSQKRAK